MKYLAISVVILILSFFNLLSPVSNVAQFLLNPLQRTFYASATNLSNFVEFLGSISSLYAQNQDLKEEVLDLQTTISNLSSQIESQEVFKEHSDSFDSNFEYIMANLLGNANDLTRTTLYLDRGARDGVVVGSPVVYKNNLLGKIINVSPSRSLFSLLYSPQTSVSVKNISASSPSEGIVSGKFGLGLKLERVLQREELKIGDIYVTTGKDGYFPPNLIVGKVSEIYDTPTEPLKSARLQPLIDVDKIYKVFILQEKE